MTVYWASVWQLAASVRPKRPRLPRPSRLLPVSPARTVMGL